MPYVGVETAGVVILILRRSFRKQKAHAELWPAPLQIVLEAGSSGSEEKQLHICGLPCHTWCWKHLGPGSSL